MRVFDLSSSLWLPRPLGELFPFFAEASNLGRITPPWLRFEILTSAPIEMAPGTLIDYRIRLRGIPMRWRTSIEVWQPPHLFVDRQLRGPYRMWRHEHRFSERDGGTQVADDVRYAVWGGGLIDRLIVRREVDLIFAYRKQRLLELFAKRR